jgi:predicted nuclease of predicted toxin-antitoxin system
MRLYLDDDSAGALLVRLLRNAGHDVQIPLDTGLRGADDPVHFAHAIQEARVLLSHNHRDFRNLHNLIMLAGGHHPGVLIVRRDNDPHRDLKPKGIVRAVANLTAALSSLRDGFQVLNQWR